MDYEKCKQTVEQTIDKYLSTLDYDSRITDGIKYVLTEGKRLRPAITLSVLEKLQPLKWQEYSKACLIPELIHTASLIIDDFPSFDNAQLRREKECLHLKFGEAIAYLISFTLV